MIQKTISETRFLNDIYAKLQAGTLVLPTLPEIALKIRKVAEDEKSSLSDMTRIINTDPALAARVVHVANSPAFRTRSPFNSVDMAVRRMGSNTIKNVVTSMVMEQLFHAKLPATDQRLRQAWTHAMEVSQIAMGLIVNHPHLAPDQALLGCLIHNIGLLPVVKMGEENSRVIEDMARFDLLVEDVHKDVGATIMQCWQFGKDMVDITRSYDSLTYEHEGPPNLLDLTIVAHLCSEKSLTKLSAINDPYSVPAVRKIGLPENFKKLAKSA